MIMSKAEQIAQLLKQQHPSPKTELVHKNEYELAVAVMLSAQTTDKKVNQITPKFFAQYPNWVSLSKAVVKDVEAAIYGVNFHKGKAVRLVAAAKTVLKQFGGSLPHELLQLTKIPGIARKSANVIMQELWDSAEGIVVDTHVTRVSQRLGLTVNTNPVKIEKDLINLIPREFWRNFSGATVLHGRYICMARKPKCGECVLNKICPSAFRV